MAAYQALRRLAPVLAEACSTSSASVQQPAAAMQTAVRRFQGLAFAPWSSGSVPSDPSAQATMLRELNQGNTGQEAHQRVVQLFEAGQVAMTEANLCEYVKALATLDKLNGSRLSATLHQGAAAAAAGRFAQQPGHDRMAAPTAAASTTSAAAALGTAERPLHMRQADRSMRDQLWATFRTALVTILFIAGLGVLVDERSGMTKPFLSSSDLKPQKVTSTTFEDVKGVDEAKEELQVRCLECRWPGMN